MRTLLCFTMLAFPALAADLSGTWVLRLTSFGEETVTRLVLRVSGDKVTGQLSDDVQIEGTLTGNA